MKLRSLKNIIIGRVVIVTNDKYIEYEGFIECVPDELLGREIDCILTLSGYPDAITIHL